MSGGGAAWPSDWLLGVPAALQGAALAYDEAVFHRRRGLPRWERIGHPLDTLTIVACFAWARAHAGPGGFAPGTLWAYVALAVTSCAFVTKDELVHARRCAPAEQWLHSVLFLLHSTCLGATAVAWWRASEGSSTALAVLSGQLAAVTVCLLAQAAYWNVIRRGEHVDRQLGLRDAG